MKVECLNVCACGAGASDLFPFQQWKQLLLVMKIIGIVKGLCTCNLCTFTIKKLSLLFCKIRQKNRMQLSAVCFNFAQHNNEQTLPTLKNTGFKTNQFGLGKRVHVGLILPSKFDCLFNPSLMDDLTQLMALFVSIIIFTFFFFFYFMHEIVIFTD